MGHGLPPSRLPSLALDSETLANVSELRFRNDLNMGTLFLGKVCGVYFRDYEFLSRAKAAWTFPPGIAFQL